MLNGHGWGGSMWGEGGMWLWWVLIVAVVIAFAVWMARTYVRPGSSAQRFAAKPHGFRGGDPA